MKCNEKKTVVLTKEEKKTLEILNYYDCRLIEGYGNLVYALELGEYVIGGSIYDYIILYCHSRQYGFTC